MRPGPVYACVFNSTDNPSTNSHGTNYLQIGQSNSNKTCFMQSTIGNFNSPSFIMHTFTYVSAFCVSFNH